MDKQTENIVFFDDSKLRLKTGRIVETENEVVGYKNGVVYVKLNRNIICSVNAEDYFRYSLWAHRICFSHADANVGVVAYDNGYDHRSLPALIMQTEPGQKVGYRNGNHCDICRENLYIKGI